MEELHLAHHVLLEHTNPIMVLLHLQVVGVVQLELIQPVVHHLAHNVLQEHIRLEGLHLAHNVLQEHSIQLAVQLHLQLV